MIERRTSIVEVGGVVGYRKACEEKEGQELKHACVQEGIVVVVCQLLLSSPWQSFSGRRLHIYVQQSHSACLPYGASNNAIML